MAEASPVPGTPSGHPQAQLGQPINPNAAIAPSDALNTAGPPGAGPPLFPLALMGRTRVQTIQLREGDSTAEMVTSPPNNTEPSGSMALNTPTPSVEKSARASRVKNTSSAPTTTVTVDTDKDFNRLFEMISGLDAKTQAIGEMMERELSPAAREQTLPRPPPPTGFRLLHGELC